MHRRSILTVAGAILAVLVGVSVTAASAAAPDPSPPAVPHTVAAQPLAAPSFQPPHEDVFVPITPCKIVDTRLTAAGQFGNLTTRTFYVSGTTGFAPQGGKAGGCGVPVGATAISATLIAVTPSNVGYFRAYPTGAVEPDATVLTYANMAVSSGATVALSTSAAKPLTVRNHNGPSHLVINVTGYYVKQLSVMISPSGSLYAGSSRAISSSRTGTGVYLVQFDRNIEFCSATASVYVSNYYASTSTYYASPFDTVQVRVFDAGGVATDQYVYLNVSC